MIPATSARPLRPARAAAEADPLSEREREVLRLLALGHTNQEIAKMLYISVRTAETHRAHIMQKLRLSSRAELVRHALSRGQIGGVTVHAELLRIERRSLSKQRLRLLVLAGLQAGNDHQTIHRFLL